MQIYEKSKRKAGSSEYFICKEGNNKYLGIIGIDSKSQKFDGKIIDDDGKRIKLCDLTSRNAALLQKTFPFTKPVRNLDKSTSIGLGDRLGLATPGHIRLVEKYDIFPVFAQQSIRELNLTGRTYADVLSSAVFAVFQEGYEKGYGADGDHLKTAEEVNYALDNDFTMITLDCSEHIVNDLNGLDEKYMGVDVKNKKELEEEYLNAKFILNSGKELEYSEYDLRKAVVMYTKAIEHTCDIYYNVIKKRKADIDFEISIDETLGTTSPQDHFFVARELKKAGIRFTSLAPRFCGEFQKGIDYIGDIDDFKRDFSTHAMIAETLGYKISVHSGSDKFSVFPYVGEYTDKKFHLKTAGTNWLEAIRTISVSDPVLYRDIHRFALANLEKAKKYYHIGAKPERILSLGSLKDNELKILMDLDDSRQAIHITYGLILQDPGLKKRIYEFLGEHEDSYYRSLEKHIGKHLEMLGL